MKKKLTALIMCMSLLLTTGCSGSLKTLRFGAADIGGMYYSFATTYTSYASKDNDELKFDIKTTAGSVANLRLLSGRYIDLGIAQADLIDAAYNGTGDFKESSYRGYKAIGNLYTEACQIVVRNDSDITSIDDLQGKTVSIGASESGTERNANLILQLSGLTNDFIRTVNLDYTEAADKLKNKEIDAFFCTAGTRTTIIEELTRQCDIRLISIDDKCISRLTSAYPYYSEYTIPANTYTGQNYDIKTIGVKSVLLASDKLSNDTVKQLTDILFKHANDIQYSTSLDTRPDKKYATEGITIPFHPGAVSYYEEHGIKVTSE